MKQYYSDYKAQNFSLKIDARGLEDWQKRVTERMPAIVKKHAFVVQGKAQAKAPVDTGALKNSIMAEGLTILSWRISDGVEYGIFQELGHGGANIKAGSDPTAKHFLGNACETSAQAFFDDIAGAMKA
jgi:hypothetical protein